MIIFDLTTPLSTKDNFQVKLKGFVELTKPHDEAAVIASISRSAKDYLATIPLLDALDLVNAEQAQKLVPGLGDLATDVAKLEVSTVDAVEEVKRETVNVDIDPSLEGQKQKQGLFSRVKGLFKR